jgi:hypothetical protein
MKKMILVLMLALAGCATGVMQSLVGKTLSEVQAKYGPPVNVIDGGVKGRGFQWQLGYSPTGSKCYYTLYGQPQGKDYLITSFEEPRGLCE